MNVRGRKSWALIAYLALERAPATRRTLASLFGEGADDPLGALRWTVFQARRALRPGFEIEDRDGALALTEEGDAVIDVVQLETGTLAPQEVEQTIRGELLEGFEFPNDLGLDGWVSMQRARLKSASVDFLRWAASLQGSDNPKTALRLLERATRLAPFDDALHELVVDVHSSNGDRAGARDYVERIQAMYRRELGIDPPPTLVRPLEHPHARTGVPFVTLDIAARSTLAVAEARFAAGDYEGALGEARHAAEVAARSGDLFLEARGLIALAGLLIHSLRGRDDEARGLLHRATQLAAQVGSEELMSDAEREIGYVWMLEGRYGAAEAALTRALSVATSLDDPGRIGRLLSFRGICGTDRGALEAAETDLQAALETLGRAGDGPRIAYTRGSLARVLTRAGRLDEAAAQGQRAVEEARASGALSVAPWPMVWTAEALAALDRTEEARSMYEEAFAVGCGVGDPCWESLALTGLARLRASTDRSEASEMLVEAVDRCRRHADTYKWAEASALTNLIEVEEGASPQRVAQALEIASAGPMPDLIMRLRPFSDPQTLQQTAIS